MMNGKVNKTEIKLLKRSKFIISHNQDMTDYLISHGIDSNKIVNLELFDYLCNEVEYMSTLKQAFIARYQQWYEDNKELIKENNKFCNELLKKFYKKYNLDSISTLTLDDYILGKGKDTFCYVVEYESDRLGGVRGSYPSMKYLVYYSKEGKYTWKKNCSFGNNENEIFDNVKSCLIELIKSIILHDDKDFESNRLNSLFKNKLEYLYNYEESLPIYSEFDVEIVLTLLEINFDKKDSIISKRKKLYEFYKSLNLKNSTPFNFVSFLYSPY